MAGEQAAQPNTRDENGEPEPGSPAATAPEGDPAKEVAPEGRFGVPGPPLKRNPFLIGFLGGLGILLAYGVFVGLSNAASILVLIFIAMFLAVGLNPAVVRLRAWGVPRGLAVTAVTLGILLLFCGGLTALIPPLVTQSTEFVQKVPDLLASLQRNQTIRDLVERYDLLARVQSIASPSTISNALGGVFGGAALVFGTIFNVVTVLVLTIYFMSAFDRIKETAYRLVPASRRQRVRLIADEILAKVGAYMVGALAIAVLAGVCTWIFAQIVGLGYPFALAVVVAICDLIPQVGATIGAVIVSIVGFATSWQAGVACVIFFVVYQQAENFLIYPTVMRKSVAVSDVAAVTAALLGVALFGVIGALIAIPMVAAVQLIMREIAMPSMDLR